ncbi:MAG: MFS transporter, partial [Planktomarina sp.]
FRAFLAVLAPVLDADLGATAVDLTNASSAWFLVFAAMQIPVGWALDTIGPRKTTAALVVAGCGGGCAVFALATAPWHLSVAMGLIGVGCSPVLMASFFLIARTYPAVVFATYTGLVIAIGNLGNIGASLPLAWMVDGIGWRASLVVLGAVSILCAIAIYFVTPDPERVEGPTEGSVIDLLKIPALWLIFPLMLVNYAPAAGIRGVWAGPYLADIFGSTAAQIGVATMIMGFAMVLGSALWGPLERLFKTRKWVVLIAAVIGAIFTIVLSVLGPAGYWITVALLVLIGLSGTAFPLIVAHARAFFPAHLTGRGMTLINLFGIGGVGVMQNISGRIFAVSQDGGATLAASYATVFFAFGAFVIAGIVFYAFSRDTLD